jgi:hypothetical protein
MLGSRTRRAGTTFRHLVLARIIEPVSKLDSLRALKEGGRGGCPILCVNRGPEIPV